MELSQGTLSNLKGQSVDERIVSVFHRLGFHATKRHQTKWRSIYQQNIVLSAWVPPCKLFPKGLGIDALSQESTGSGAYKVPYKIWNIQRCFQSPGLLILDGQGKEMIAAREFAISVVNEYPNLIGVCTLAEFEAWLEESVGYGQVQPFGYRERLVRSDMQASLF